MSGFNPWLSSLTTSQQLSYFIGWLGQNLKMDVFEEHYKEDLEGLLQVLEAARAELKA